MTTEVSFVISDFIGVFDNVLPSETCKAIIQYFENMQEAGFSVDRLKWQNTDSRFKKDDSVVATFEDCISLKSTRELNNSINNVIQGCYEKYADHYDVIKEIGTQAIVGNKIQKTTVGGGYHIWHCEHSSTEPRRVAAYILYLNDVEDGGETEFLYLHKRIKPKAGTLVMFPSGYTHAHRGNPPLVNDKYIVTGWLEFSC